MATAAVPKYLEGDFSQCPPGHRFTLYGSFWEPENHWARVKNIEPELHLKSIYDRMPAEILRLRDALGDRQRKAAGLLGNAVHILEALSVSPLVTGTGIEHPLENGMAFLNPYGLPYLPGSSVKGVLRRAAEELRDDPFGEGTGGWDQEAIDLLFGREAGDGDTEHTRGALVFWDAIPRCDRLAVDIMNPHYGTYYQGKSSPHDAGSPVPIYFLVVPPETPFAFHVQCELGSLPTDQTIDWKTLMDVAFAHAFDWCGFGAKTAVGYGAMARDRRAEEEARKRVAEADARRASEEAEHERLAEAAAETARQQAEFEALPESRKQLIALSQALAVFENPAGGSVTKDKYAELVGVLNKFAHTAKHWANSEERGEAADRLAAAYDQFGWGTPGTKRDKRARQEKKKREVIYAVRQGL